MSLDLAREIALAARVVGGRALIVGGWVRDRLRGHPSKDIDLEVFAIPQDRLAPLLAPFGRVEAVGQRIPCDRIDGEVAPPRRIFDRHGRITDDLEPFVSAAGL